VNSHREIFGKIIPFFRKYPLKFPSKRKTFEGFCKIAKIIQRREHTKSGGIEKIQKLSKKLH